MSSSTEQHLTPEAGGRRRFLKQMGIAGIALGPGSAFLASCASGGDDDDDDDAGSENTPAEDVSEENPLGVDESGEVEIWIFDGGFSDTYATDIHEPILQEKYPDITINHNKAVDIAGQLQQRFVGGDPPDVVDNAGDGQMDFTQLTADGLVADLTPLLDAPSWDDPAVTVRDTLVAGVVELGTLSGIPVQLNYAYTVFGLWYNKTMFDENGWNTQPATWDEMFDLCEEIKKFGIAPWIYQGETAPRYMNWPLLSSAIKEAGPEIMIPVDNLEPGAWQHEAIVGAADKVFQMADKGYFMPDIEGMDFRDVQALWAANEAAIAPSGSWLENEEADTIAEDPTYELAYMYDPMLSASGGALPLEALRATASEPFMIPADAKNPEAGMEYLRAMLSQDGATGFAAEVSSLTSSTVEIEIANPGLSSAKAALDAAGENVYNWLYPTFYTTMENPGIDQVTRKLLLAKVTAQEWAEECEQVAKEIREDDSIPKQTRES